MSVSKWFGSKFEELATVSTVRAEAVPRSKDGADMGASDDVGFLLL
jgi:hypothetical protein